MLVVAETQGKPCIAGRGQVTSLTSAKDSEKDLEPFNQHTERHLFIRGKINFVE